MAEEFESPDKQDSHLPFARLYSSIVQSLSFARIFVTPMNCRMPGFLVLLYLLEFAQIHVH